MTPFLLSPWSGASRKREHSTGTIVTATKSDIASENDTTAASDPKVMLATPVRNSIGTNTAMCVSVDARIADHTSSLPSIAAVSRSLPISRWR